LRRISYEYRVGISTASVIIDETLKALVLKLCPKYLKMPNGQEEWMAIADRFSSEWQFPNCIGALDGKHVHMFPPKNSGSLYYNYKEGFSIVLMALVDADYKFIGVDIGANGKCSDSGIWGPSKLRDIFAKNVVGIPAPKVLPNTNVKSPFVIIADSGFQLEDFVMRPYGENNITPRQRIFNYRHVYCVFINSLNASVTRSNSFVQLPDLLNFSATDLNFFCYQIHTIF
jgi:DDE superfamily endonuclease